MFWFLIVCKDLVEHFLKRSAIFRTNSTGASNLPKWNLEVRRLKNHNKMPSNSKRTQLQCEVYGKRHNHNCINLYGAHLYMFQPNGLIQFQLIIFLNKIAEIIYFECQYLDIFGVKHFYIYIFFMHSYF